MPTLLTDIMRTHCFITMRASCPNRHFSLLVSSTFIPSRSRCFPLWYWHPNSLLYLLFTIFFVQSCNDFNSWIAVKEIEWTYIDGKLTNPTFRKSFEQEKEIESYLFTGALRNMTGRCPIVLSRSCKYLNTTFSSSCVRITSKSSDNSSASIKKRPLLV